MAHEGKEKAGDHSRGSKICIPILAPSCASGLPLCSLLLSTTSSQNEDVNILLQVCSELEMKYLERLMPLIRNLRSLWLRVSTQGDINACNTPGFSLVLCSTSLGRWSESPGWQIGKYLLFLWAPAADTSTHSTLLLRMFKFFWGGSLPREATTVEEGVTSPADSGQQDKEAQCCREPRLGSLRWLCHSDLHGHTPLLF